MPHRIGQADIENSHAKQNTLRVMQMALNMNQKVRLFWNCATQERRRDMVQHVYLQVAKANREFNNIDCLNHVYFAIKFAEDFMSGVAALNYEDLF